MPIQKRTRPDLPKGGYDGYECSACGAHTYNSVKMNHKPGCAEAPRQN